MNKLKFLFIKGDDATNVRLSKFIECLTKLGHGVSFWGWDRSLKKAAPHQLSDCRYLISGGGFGGGKVAIRYPLWMFKLFIMSLFSSDLRGKSIVAVNFDAALPIFLACGIRRIPYIYEIHDEFALSYKFPQWLKNIIRRIDQAIMRNASLVIHVDNNRITYPHCRHVVIENAPEDYWRGSTRSYASISYKFAVVGNISTGRGITSIYDFASRNQSVKILLVGKFYNDELKKLLLSLDNIEYHDYMPQQELFRKMEDCCAIFSLYDPSLEINRLAASNKVYDAMMMGIPVITNKEVINSKFILEKQIGLVLNYQCDETWDILSSGNFLSFAIEAGRRGRELYLNEYQFSQMISNKMIPLLK